MKNTTTENFKHGIAKPVLCEVALRKRLKHLKYDRETNTKSTF